MSLADRERVRRIAPELASVSDGDLDAFIDDARLELNQERWGCLYERALALLAAHLASVANPSLAEAAGPVTSESVGSVSRSHGSLTGSASAGLWGITRHGAEYQRLLRQVGPAAMVI